MSDLHLDRQIIARTKSTYDSLYSAHLVELDANGETVGRDLIPWKWTLEFFATEMAVRSSFDISKRWKRFLSDEPAEPDEAVEVSNDDTILVKLTPSDRGSPHGRVPRYTMMGADRTIRDFTLQVACLRSEELGEQCHVWGCPAWSAEIDFRDETIADSVMFTLAVKPSLFATYVERIRAGAITEAIFSIDGADGFYSDWSPAVSTSFIKVLTAEANQAIQFGDEAQLDFPRLGKVRRATLTTRTNLKLPFPVEPVEADHVEDEEDYISRPTPPTPEAITAQTALRIERTLKSFSFAMWFVVAILAYLALRHAI